MNTEGEWLAAAKKNDTATLQNLIQKGVSLEARDEHQRTALMLATYANNVEAARLLIRAGADVNAQDDRLESPLLHAGAYGYLEILEAILATQKADHLVLNRFGGTALIPACERGHIAVVKTLLNVKNYPINHVNNLGWTGLMEAIVLGSGGKTHTEIVQLLVDAGADANIPDKEGVTPLQHAKARGLRDIVQILQAAGAR